MKAIRQTVPVLRADAECARYGAVRVCLSYLELAKPRLAASVAIAAGAGYYLAIPETNLNVANLVHLVVAVLVLSGGGCALNQHAERDVDAVMERTRNRPVPSGRLTEVSALVAGLACSVAGFLYLGWVAGPVAAGLGAFAILTYVLIYTPLKRLSALSIVVGAVPGALPPVIGWAAASGRVGSGALVLFGMMFLWQLSHCLPIAWIHREDCQKAGMPVPGWSSQEQRVSLTIVVVSSLMLLIAGFLPAAVHLTGPIYLVGAGLVGAAFVVANVRWALRPNHKAARVAFLGALVYVVLLSALMVVDRAPR
jgi:heme o synthase